MAATASASKLPVCRNRTTLRGASATQLGDVVVGGAGRGNDYELAAHAGSRPLAYSHAIAPRSART